MRVSRVTPFLVDLGGGKNLCFVKVETDGGPHGWGECYTQADREADGVAGATADLGHVQRGHQLDADRAAP